MGHTKKILKKKHFKSKATYDLKLATATMTEESDTKDK
jgi:hypothetical protein